MLTRTFSALTLLLGFWLLATQFVFHAPAMCQWSIAITGALIGILSISTQYVERDERVVTRIAAGANTLLGLWLVIAPFLFGIDGVQRWNVVIVGVLVSSLAGYNFYIASLLLFGGSPSGANTDNP
ncbi:SPW repeat protein [Natrialba sp. SSL1]|uniref:SPW repeat protein n=1 Tax=Natrialba sp. SSL1 TaxID=1869245 RepID=UPI0008F7F564|nr:hypothetical protein BBD46_02355 [Natrialba sp. SSL1]